MRLFRRKKTIEKTTLFLLAAALLAGALLSPSASAESGRGIVTLSAGALNVRAAPGGEILTTLGNGTVVNILSSETDSSGTEWYAITLGERTGYVSSAYVRPAPEDAVLTDETPAVIPEDQAEYSESLAALGFPESYLAGLCQLHQQYPQWIFTPFYTGIDWNEAVTAESELGRSLVWGSAPSSWKSTQEGAFNWLTSKWIELDSGGWVAASRGIIAYYMDPRNSLDPEGIFQFLYQGYDPAVQTKEALVSMTAGTFLANTELDTDGDGTNGLTTYADALWDGGAANGVNPCVLAAMMLQEMGISGVSDSISGTNGRFPGVYNAFNIGAYMTDQFSAVERGLWYASGGTLGLGTSNGRPWTSLYKAICGGAQFYGENYIAAGQTTLYLKRFNVQGSRMYRNQYMTNVAGAASEGGLLATAYSETMRALPLNFSIPVYDNMPGRVSAPGGDGSPNAALAALSVSRGSTSPAFHRDITEYTMVVPYEVTSLTVSGTPLSPTAAVTGGGTVELQTGSNMVAVTVRAENGDTRTYTIAIWRQEAGDVPAPTDAPADTPAPEATTPPADTPIPGAAVLPGDLNGDGAVQINDLILLRNHLLGTALLEGNALTAADTDGDGAVQINDLIRIRNHLLGTAPLF